MDKLLSSEYGPLMNVLRFLDDRDIKKLCFVHSSSKQQMMIRFNKFKELSVLGRKLENKVMDTKTLSYYHLIPIYLKFIDGLAPPLNVMNDEQMAFINKNISSMTNRIHSDFDKLQSAVSIGQKVNPKDLTCFGLVNKFAFRSFLKSIIHKYDAKYVSDMICKKILAFILSLDNHYILVLDLYKCFGSDFVNELWSLLDETIYFDKLFDHFAIYSRYVENILECCEQNKNYTKFELEQIIQDGADLLNLIEIIYERFPKYKFLDRDSIIKFSMYELKYQIESL
jgi:hypothetical protein